MCGKFPSQMREEPSKYYIIKCYSIIMFKAVSFGVRLLLLFETEL